METKEVHSQSEFDAIPRDFDGLIIIKNTVERIFVTAWENSQVTARDNSSVLIYSSFAKVKTTMNATAKKWVDPIYTKKLFLELAEKEGDYVVLYKNVNPRTMCDFRTGKIKYEIGTDVVCPDWNPDKSIECGQGLHLSMTPADTQNFNVGTILKCLVKPKDIAVYARSMDKVRCRMVRPVAIVNIRGEVIKEVDG